MVAKGQVERENESDPSDATEMLLNTLRTQAKDNVVLADAMVAVGIPLCAMESGIDMSSVCDAEVFVNDWMDVEFEVALDSGSIVHVCRDSDSPGYELSHSEGSKRGRCFLVGNGGKMPELGQKKLRLEVPQEGDQMGLIASVFQIAQVSRPLMSVGQICDEGHDVSFTATTATVKNQNGKVICEFVRNDGGLYIAKMSMKAPFVRPE